MPRRQGTGSGAKTRHSGLTWLKRSRARAPAGPRGSILEGFRNPSPTRPYHIRFDCPEFTSLCPITGQPDFGHLRIDYVPDRWCIESKSLKLYLFSFRNRGAFHEAVVNRILDDVVAAIRPKSAVIVGEFRPRGGIAITVEARHPAGAAEAL